MHEVLKAFLTGVYDEFSVLNVLLGKPHIIQYIWELVKSTWKEHIKLPAEYDEYYEASPDEEYGTTVQKEVYFFKYCPIYMTGFPDPSGINVNMMPFIASREFKDTKLPDYIKPYADLIRDTIGYAYGWGGINRNEIEGSIYFVTIQESWVDANTSQRRPGLHTDNPGPLLIKKKSDDTEAKGSYSDGSGSCDLVAVDHHWGNVNTLGGIYMASNVENSCRVWDCKIDVNERTGEEVISSFGDIEHLRPFLPEPEILQPNALYWITDRTPHESLPLEKGQFRQFFRIVTSDVSLWFADDNTANPNGVKPDPSITKIVKGSKFVPGSLEIVDCN